jgi:hypothetical protein
MTSIHSISSPCTLTTGEKTGSVPNHEQSTNVRGISALSGTGYRNNETQGGEINHFYAQNYKRLFKRFSLARIEKHERRIMAALDKRKTASGDDQSQAGGKIARTSKHYTICPHCGHGYIRAGICRGWMTCCICRLPMKVVE